LDETAGVENDQIVERFEDISFHFGGKVLAFVEDKRIRNGKERFQREHWEK
jgi:hypothetical protein